MTTRLPRLLLAFASLILGLGGLSHAAAFPKALAAIAPSGLPAFYAGSYKALWLADSCTLITLAIVFGVVVVRPAAVNGFVVALLALIPAATAVLIYVFVGSFLPAHLLLAAAVAAFVAGLMHPRAIPAAS